MQTAPPKGRELLLRDSGIHRAGYCSSAHESAQAGSSPVCLLALLRVTGEILSATGIHSVLRFADTDSVAIWVMPAVALAELITDQDGVRRPLDGEGGTSPDRRSVRIRALPLP